MASWHPADGSHGGLAGAPDAFCFTCGQYCGGFDAAGSVLVCRHCAALGLPPAPEAPAGDGQPLPDGGVVTPAGPGQEPVRPGDSGPMLWGGQQIPLPWIASRREK